MLVFSATEAQQSFIVCGFVQMTIKYHQGLGKQCGLY